MQLHRYELVPRRPTIRAVTPGPPTLGLGPADGDLLVHAFRDGLAQKVGHDLILEVNSWTAAVELGDDSRPAAVVLEADPTSLSVREALHGVKPLTNADRRSIRENIVAKVLGTQAIAFRSERIDAGPGELAVAGSLSLHGRSRPVSFSLAHDDGRLTGGLILRQSDWGITPYRALMGALKVRDEVELRIAVRLPTADPAGP